MARARAHANTLRDDAQIAQENARSAQMQITTLKRLVTELAGQEERLVERVNGLQEGKMRMESQLLALTEDKREVTQRLDDLRAEHAAYRESQEAEEVAMRIAKETLEAEMEDLRDKMEELRAEYERDEEEWADEQE